MFNKTILMLSSLALMVSGKATTLAKIDLTSIDPLAVCNDGTPAVYYWKTSSNPTNKWLVFLNGGDQCYSKLSCQARRKFLFDLTSSKNYGSTRDIGGVFDDSTAISPLADANKAFVMYCSSDGHMGDQEATDDVPF